MNITIKDWKNQFKNINELKELISGSDELLIHIHKDIFENNKNLDQFIIDATKIINYWLDYTYEDAWAAEIFKESTGKDCIEQTNEIIAIECLFSTEEIIDLIICYDIKEFYVYNI